MPRMPAEEKRPQTVDEDFDEVRGGFDVKQTILEQHGYSITKSLGHGSYATVKQAYSTKHSTNVAIKIISKRRAPPDYLQKFLPRELDVVKLLKHPNLVIFLQSIETNTRVYIVMEEAGGGCLLDTIRKNKRLNEKMAGYFFKQLCDGIEYCHSLGVVHRDLKCENLLLDLHGNLKIIDFGFARSDMAPTADGKYKRSETYCGSYAYAAPEILMGMAYIPQKSDIWSMGIILYVMVLGRLPFDDNNHKQLLKLVLAGPVFPNKEMSNEFKEMIMFVLKPEDLRPWIPTLRVTPWYDFVRQAKLSRHEPSVSLN